MLKKYEEAIPFSEIKDEEIGKIGTAKREIFDAKVNARADAEEICYILKKARKELKMTLQDLAKKTGIGVADLSKIESGYHFPTLPTLCRIINALDTQLSFTFKP